MTLHHKPEHHIRTAHEEHAVAHFTFADETGMRRFIDDNRTSIRSTFERWSVDWEPMLTVTKANQSGDCDGKQPISRTDRMAECNSKSAARL